MYKFTKTGKGVRYKDLYWRENRHGAGRYDSLCEKTSISSSEFVKKPSDFTSENKPWEVDLLNKGKLVSLKYITTIKEL